MKKLGPKEVMICAQQQDKNSNIKASDLNPKVAPSTIKEL
jgi:hypothetical protein